MAGYDNKSMGERICENRGFYVPSDDKKKQLARDKQVTKKLKKLKITKMQTTIIGIGVVLAIILLIVVVVCVINKPNVLINDNTNIENLDTSKYAKEIVNQYNKEGQKELFLTEMDRIQNLVGMYLLSNITEEQSSLDKILKEVESELKSNNWNKILNNKSTYYKGEYSLDESGNLKFKFASKEIEPNWVKDEKVAKYIILN